MRIDIMTLFPDSLGDVLSESILGRAQERGYIRIEAHQIRDFTASKQCQVDDYPYGGGRGAIMQADPLYRCWEHVCDEAGGPVHTIYLSPCGHTFRQADAIRLSRMENLVLVCGHYEGVDERFIEECVDEEISLGDFVLTGGEIAAMAVADAVCRLVPGVLADEQCYTGESHWDGLLEYPQYTRPEVWEGRRVPEVLLNGDHSKVAHWRRKKQLERTRAKRPDLFQKLALTDPEDQKLLREVEKEAGRKQLTEPISCEKATLEDIPRIMEIVEYARQTLGRRRVDQWQGEYPSPAVFRQDVERGELYVLRHGAELAAFFLVTDRPEPCYEEITDGKWTPDLPYCVLHRCAVAKEYRGTGLAEQMLRFAEETARSLGGRTLRVDTHRKNKPMQQLLRSNGYRYRGNVLVDENGHDPARQAFEKILKK